MSKHNQAQNLEPEQKPAQAELKVLITRPKKQANALACELDQHGISNYSFAMFDYQATLSTEQCQQFLHPFNLDESSVKAPIVIFVSVAAVEYAQACVPISSWPHSKIIAVGKATQQALTQLELDAICPSQFDSEGLLALPELSQVAGQNIIIVRGNGGRELLAQQLNNRGAHVSYLEVYQRVWAKLTNKQISEWQRQAINCIVVTSNALLENVAQPLLTSAKTVDEIKIDTHHWQNNCLWLCASERIANNAKQLGLKHIINAGGASNSAILNVLRKALSAQISGQNTSD